MRTIFTLLVFILTSSHVAYACHKAHLNPREAFKEADIIFRGKVENLRYLDAPNKTKTEPRIIVTFRTSEIWKGTADNTLTLHTTHNKSTCNGYIFKVGEEYLVYSHYNRRADNFLAKLFAPDTPTLGVKVYGGTKHISNAKQDLKYLGKGMAN